MRRTEVICTSATGKQYRHRVDDSGLRVEALPTAPIKAYHKPDEKYRRI